MSLKPAPIVQAAPCDGYLASCSLYITSNNFCPPLVTRDVVIDVLMNGVSVFNDGDLMVWKAGETAIQYQNRFNASPLSVRRGDLFSLSIDSDYSAQNGILVLELLVI